MIQETYQKAMKFAGEKHANQRVPASKANYLLHLSNVAMEVLIAYQNNPNFDCDFAVQVAILHDILEDTSTSFNELEDQFGEPIATAVLALTKDKLLPNKKEQMRDSLKRINTLQKEVGLVKLADRITNLQKPPAHWGKDKIKQYHKEAQLISKTLANKNEFLNLRLIQKNETYQLYFNYI